jgi:transposase
MTEILAQSAGIDICKHFLDVAFSISPLTNRFENTPKGCVAAVEFARAHGADRVCFEATGAYHRDLEYALGKSGICFVKANPRKVRRFADVIGVGAKTDRVDAKVLAKFISLIAPRQSQIKSEALITLGELLGAKSGLLKDRTAVLNRSKNLRIPLLKRQSAARLKQIEGQIAAIEKQAKDLVATDQLLRKRFEILLSIPGIGETTALVLLAEMPELGTLDQRQVASLAGLAPLARESGKWAGKRFTQGGRAKVRQALYMPILVAIRCNPALKEKYEALIAAGKPPKVAIIAVMRKALILANALIRDDRHWMKIRTSA